LSDTYPTIQKVETSISEFLASPSPETYTPMTIRQAQHTVDEWIRSIGVRYFHELTNTAVLMEEVGEMARLMARLYGEQSFKSPAEAADAPAQLADEMAASEARPIQTEVLGEVPPSPVPVCGGAVGHHPPPPHHDGCRGCCRAVL
jgi:hypothetical protein